MYYFYIVRCKDNSLYCGQTSNLERRIVEHNSGNSKTAKYTRAHSPVKLVYFEEYSTIQLAMSRELEVKKWPKNKKEELVTSKVLDHS